MFQLFAAKLNTYCIQKYIIAIRILIEFRAKIPSKEFYKKIYICHDHIYNIYINKLKDFLNKIKAKSKTKIEKLDNIRIYI